MSSIEYTVRSPWEWVLEQVESDVPMKRCVNSKEMASAMLAPTPNTRRKLNQKKGPQPCTLRLDVVDQGGRLIEAHHGTSSALNGLEDKDELVRTFQRCRAVDFGITPPSTLIRWDATLQECQNVIKNLPTLETNSEHTIAVLKEPIGSRGEGIYFVSSVQEIFDILEKNRKQAVKEGEDFLDTIMEQKGRIPSWVLQAEVHPPLLIRGERKFHIRSYVVGTECLEENHLLNLYVYNRHEVRIAAMPVTDGDTERDPMAHITNGSVNGGTSTQRVVMDAVEELAHRQQALEHFLANALTTLLPDIIRRVGYTSTEQPPEIQKHIMSGFDIMMTSDYRFYILEVNVNPAAPSKATASEDFTKHLVGFMTDLKSLVLGHDSPNFVITDEILNRGPGGANGAANR